MLCSKKKRHLNKFRFRKTGNIHFSVNYTSHQLIDEFSKFFCSTNGKFANIAFFTSKRSVQLFVACFCSVFIFIAKFTGLNKDKTTFTNDSRHSYSLFLRAQHNLTNQSNPILYALLGLFTSKILVMRCWDHLHYNFIELRNYCAPIAQLQCVYIQISTFRF